MYEAVIISNKEMKDIIKILKSIEESGFLTEGVIKAIENKVKELKSGFLWKILGTLGPNLLGKMFASKKVIQA